VELTQRAAGALPPLTRMTRIVLRDEDHLKCLALAKTTAERLRRLAGEAVRVRGPAPCPIARIAGKHRQQIELLAPTAGVMQSLLAAARSEGVIKAGAAMAIDVDPIALL
jgi:primosomal protein N' (replication factor Y) (superfamily II helicase)